MNHSETFGPRALPGVDASCRKALESADLAFGFHLLDMIGREWVAGVASIAFLSGYHGDGLHRSIHLAKSTTLGALGPQVAGMAGYRWVEGLVPGLYLRGVEAATDDRAEELLAAYTEDASISS
jgi:hypothetical protein